MTEPDHAWLDRAALVLVARDMVEAWGQRGNWVVTPGLRTRGYALLWSRPTQSALDRAADAGWIITPSGSVRTKLTEAGLMKLCGAFHRDQLAALGDIGYVVPG